MPENPLFTRGDPTTARVMSANELVSYNLLRARRMRGWKQSEVGELLGRYTGRAWSNASVSAAERAWQGGRPRKFDADEIAALSQIFDVPYSFFLLPPDEITLQGVACRDAEASDPTFDSIPVIEYLKSILGVDASDDFLDRVQEVVREYATLDFIPAKWELVIPSQAYPAKGAPDLQDAEQAARELDRLVSEAHLPKNFIDLLTEVRSREISFAVAHHLDERGYIKQPGMDDEMAELKRRVEVLSKDIEERHAAVFGRDRTEQIEREVRSEIKRRDVAE